MSADYNKHVKCKSQFIGILRYLEILYTLCKHILPKENVTKLKSIYLYLEWGYHFNRRRMAGEVHIAIK